MSEDVPSYYASPGRLTDPGEKSTVLDGLPVEISGIRDVVQGLVVHAHWAQEYGLTLDAERSDDAHARTLPAILERIAARDARPLSVAREPAARFAGTCRDFTLLTCAILHHQGRPARARCGFATYFEPDRFVDHWVCESWDASRGGWVRIDAQLDALQRDRLRVDFDPLDVPDDRFWVAGKAWEACQAGAADPSRFGIFDLSGSWFIRGNLVRDLAALNRVELLPWDDWGIVRRLGMEEVGSAQDQDLLARVAAITQSCDAAFTATRELYESEPDLKVPGAVRNVLHGRDEAIP